MIINNLILNLWVLTKYLYLTFVLVIDRFYEINEEKPSIYQNVLYFEIKWDILLDMWITEKFMINKKRIFLQSTISIDFDQFEY